MTESERQLQEMALSIQAARQQAGCRAAVTAPPAAADTIPNLGGEARAGDCLVSMLASGSKGNAAYIRCGKTNILIDAGISCRRIEQGLKRYGCALGDLDAVFITHEHSDHVNGLATLLKRTDMPVYMTAETWQAIGRKVEGFQDRFVRLTRRVGPEGHPGHSLCHIPRCRAARRLYGLPRRIEDHPGDRPGLCQP